jgi:transposase
MRINPSSFLPHLKGLRFDQIEVSEHRITLTVTAIRATAACPLYQHRSKKVHSSYTRTVADLPWSGITVSLRVQTRRFACPLATCERKIFCERLTPFVAVYGRRTHQVRASLERLGLALAGRAGARAAATQRTSVSRTTLLRLVRALPCPPVEDLTVVGVDDFAQRKGRTYGTIVCDLVRQRPVDLLPERSADSWAAWLALHPTIEVVSRDRGHPYGEGTTRGAPNAVQVADRWHLLRNAGAALERLVTREQAALRQASRAEADTRTPLPAPQRLTKAHRQQAARLAARVTRYAQVRQLVAQGYSQRAVAQVVGLDRDTVRAYLRADGPPVIQTRAKRHRLIDRYAPYLQRRWQEGCRTVTILFQEIRDQGYAGSYTSCAAYLHEIHPTRRATPSQPKHAAPAPLSPRQVVWLFLTRPEKLTAENKTTLVHLVQASKTLAAAYSIVQSFARMVRERQGDRLDAWIHAATTSGLPDLRSFAYGLLRDKAAVRAGLTLVWSQGQTEGQVNRVNNVS